MILPCPKSNPGHDSIEMKRYLHLFVNIIATGLQLAGIFSLICVFSVMAAENVLPELELAVANYKEGDYEAAYLQLEGLDGALSDEGQLHYWKGKAAFMLMRPKQASDHYYQALDLGHETSDTYFGLGQALGAWAMDASIFTQARLAGKIRRAFEDSLKIDPDHFDANFALMMYYEQAPGFMGGSWDDAVALGERARSLKLVEGSYALADMYRRKKKTDLAIKVAEDLIEEESGNPDHWVFLFTFLLSAKKFEGWESRYSRFENDFGDYPTAQYQFGKYAALTGRALDKGELSLRSYIIARPEKGPSIAHAHWRLGQILEHLNEEKDAMDAYATALELNPEDKEFLNSQKRLARAMRK
tara:strand:- start:6858 stop:7931 length:1074 start_codon:yes stop_codon:yes gene_type:complete